MAKANINDYLTTSEHSLDKLAYSPPLYHCQDYQKINIWNANIEIPLQKIWLIIERVKIYQTHFVSDKPHQTGKIGVVLFETDEKIKKIYSLLKKIQIKIKSHLHKNHNKKLIMKPCIEEIPDICKVLNLKISFERKENGDIIYQNMVGCKNKKSLKEDMYISVLIELSEVWFNSENFGFNWKIRQFKIHPEINFEKSIFDDGEIHEEEEQPQYQPYSSKHPPPPPPPPKNGEPKKISPFRPPTQKEILSIKLKPIPEKSNTEIPEINNTDNAIIN